MVRPTLRDVADRAGVSISTVSYVLNGSRSVALADATRARVHAAARDLGYVPNGLARSLQSRASATIGMILGKPLTSGRYAAIAEGAAAQLRRTGRQLVLIGEHEASRAVRDVRAQRLDGLAFVGHDDRTVPDELAAAVAEHDVPFVAIDCHPLDGAAYPTVDFDYAVGVKKAYEDFAARGVREVIYLRPDIESPAEAVRSRAIEGERRRWPAILTRAVSSGMTAHSLELLDADPAAAVARAIALVDRAGEALALAEAPPEQVAVLCAWGADAESAYVAAQRKDPRIRVTALASGALSPALWPGLAYSKLPLERAGREAARIIATRQQTAERVVLAPTHAASPEHPEEDR